MLQLGHLRAVAVGLLLCTATPGTAQVLLSPVVVEMNAKARTAVISVTLSEAATRPIRLQTELLRWQQGLHGEAITEPTDEVLVSPAIADLQPGQRQLFRVALRGPRRAPEELAYRLILEDVAEPQVDEAKRQAMAINFRMRYDIAVLIAPVVRVVTALRWKPCPAVTETAKPTSDDPAGTEICLRLLNSGNRRVKMQTLTVRGDNWQEALSQKDMVSLLVGAEREIRVRPHPGQSGALRSVEVQMTSGEMLQAELGGF